MYLSYKANEGHIVKGGGIVSVTAFGYDLLSSILVNFNNSGKKAVSLRHFVPSDVEKVLLTKGERVISTDEFEYEFYITESSQSYLELSLYDARRIGSYDLEAQPFIDVLIKPRETHEANILVLVKAVGNEITSFVSGYEKICLLFFWTSHIDG